ncbi:MAG: hypothetical protein OEV91_10820 [Desulfobulbaceae bacterium]|nr:hypothetical protein [Desulfobulbaceae bacterium]
MAKKKEEKDILDEVLCGAHDHHVPGLDELTNLIQRHAKPNKEAPPKKRNKLRQPKGTKKKSTHYLSEEVFEELTDARDRIQLMLPEELSQQVSKSGIVDTALKMILRELEEKGKNSILLKQIIKDKQEK